MSIFPGPQPGGGSSGPVAVGDIDATGTPSASTYLRGDGAWETPVGGGTPISFVRYTGVAARGSTNTYVLRYSTHQQTEGTDITYAASSTLGDCFTVNTSGIYSVTVGGTSSPGSMILLIQTGPAITNSVALTDTATRAQGLVLSGSSQQACSWTGYVAAGDKIWISSDTAPYNAAGYELTNNVNISRVG